MRLVDAQIVVFERCIAHAVAEGPLLSDARIVVVGTFHCSHFLTLLEVVVGKRVDLFRIGDGHLTTEVLASREQGRQRVTAIVAGQEDVHYGLSLRLNVGDETWASFIENENDGLARGFQGADELSLVGRECEVGEIAGRLGVGVLTDAGNDDIDAVGSLHSRRNVGLILLIVLTFFIVGDTLSELTPCPCRIRCTAPHRWCCTAKRTGR